MLAGALVLARTSITSWPTGLLAALAFLLLQRTRINSAVVVLGAAVVRALLRL